MHIPIIIFFLFYVFLYSFLDLFYCYLINSYVGRRSEKVFRDRWSDRSIEASHEFPGDQKVLPSDFCMILFMNSDEFQVEMLAKQAKSDKIGQEKTTNLSCLNVGQGKGHFAISKIFAP